MLIRYLCVVISGYALDLHNLYASNSQLGMRRLSLHGTRCLAREVRVTYINNLPNIRAPATDLVTSDVRLV